MTRSGPRAEERKSGECRSRRDGSGIRIGIGWVNGKRCRKKQRVAGRRPTRETSGLHPLHDGVSDSKNLNYFNYLLWTQGGHLELSCIRKSVVTGPKLVYKIGQVMKPLKRLILFSMVLAASAISVHASGAALCADVFNGTPQMVSSVSGAELTDYDSYLNSLLDRSYDTWFTDTIPDVYRENKIFQLSASLKGSVRKTWPAKFAMVDRADLDRMEQDLDVAQGALQELVSLLDQNHFLADPGVREGLIRIIDTLIHNEDYLLDSQWAGSTMYTSKKIIGVAEKFAYKRRIAMRRAEFRDLRERLSVNRQQ